MGLGEIALPKTYKNGKILFEKDLDVWRTSSEEAFANIQLNFNQLAKDCFSAGYLYGNDGQQDKFPSLEDRIAQFEGGNADITGTASDTFTINTDGNGATLDTASLTSTHTFLFPDMDGTFLLVEGIQSVTGAKTFDSLALKILATGGGTGVASLLYANNNNNRSYTIPNAGANAEFVMSEGASTINGAKTFGSTILAFNGLDLNGMILTIDADADTNMSSLLDDQIEFIIGGSLEITFSTTAATFGQTIIATDTAVAIDLNANGNRIDIDADNDTSIRCTADDILTFEIGGSDDVIFNTTSATFNQTIIAADTAVAIDLNAIGNRIDLDADNDTSIRCTADDTITIEVNGVDAISINSSGELILPDIDPPADTAINRNSGIAGRVYFNDGIASIIPRYNVTSVTDDDGDGEFIINWDNDVDSLNTNVTCTPRSLSAHMACVEAGHSTSTTIQLYDDAGSPGDVSFEIVCAGMP